MGKPESKPPVGQSVDQLMSSIRQAIEADAAREQASLKPPVKATDSARSTIPMAPRIANVSASITVPATPSIQTQSPEFAPSTPAPDYGSGYANKNPYKYRHALGSSPTFMSLRNRLASLNSRTKASSGKSFASLLGGDVRQEEARARGEIIQPETFEPETLEAQEDAPIGLRTSVVDEETYSADLTQVSTSTPSASYQSDYENWTLDVSLDEFSDHEPYDEQQVMLETPVEEDIADHEQMELADEGDESTEMESELPLEIMIRQVIEPELALWFDEHLPDHVAAAMPDENAFIHMIRPLIEDWLAENLESIVDKAVREEIARITGLKR